MKELSLRERQAIETLRAMRYDASGGLPQELFLLVSALVPLPNVDLLVVNERGQLLLSRRNDPYFPQGWHIPGGCMRYGEDFHQRILATARKELGCDVTSDPEPVAVRNILRGPNPQLDHPNERGHNVAILFRCYLPKGYCIDNGVKTPDDNGYLRWFETIPEDFLAIQQAYFDVLQPWLKKEDTSHA